MSTQIPPPEELPFAPAAERNRLPIFDVLRTVLRPGQRVLEIGSGTGQHAVAFTEALPGLDWLPTDRLDTLPGLGARIASEGGPGLRTPLELDVLDGPWPAGPFDAVYTANTCHIMPWVAVEAMLEGVGRVLRHDGRFLVYGPFIRDGAYTSAGDERFDAALRASDPAQGLRDLEALESAAARHHLMLERIVPMPANNFLLQLRKRIEDHD